jgi:putative flippase GtrA
LTSKLIADKKLFVLFLLTGALNTIFGYTVFAIGIFIGLDYWIALLLSTVLGVFFNFRTYGFFVFDVENKSRFLSFLIVYITLYGINLLMIYLFSSNGISKYIAGFLSLAPIALLSFYLNKRFVFLFPGTQHHY